jgi:hypothetical protein
VDEAFEDHGPLKDLKKVTDKGLVTRACFDHLAKSSDESQFSNEEIRGFLISFGLATPVEGQDCLYIPSLIQDNNRSSVMNQLTQMKKDKMSLGFLFKSKKLDEFHEVYSKLICKLYQETHISLHMGFVEKVENRPIGEVSGMWGFLKCLAQDVDRFQEFVIMETERNSMRPGDQRFARDKVM